MTSHTITGPQPTAQHRLESVALAALLVFVAALQLSIAVAHILLTATLLLWGTVVIVRRERPEVPAMFWPLGAYAVVTLVASAFSLAPSASFADSKQLVLFLIIPVVYRLARGATARTVSNVIVSVGAVAAALGIMQYGILEFDHLGQRPQGTMGHYMTYSGLLMLVIGLAAALILFSKRDRTWPALVMPALLVALALTFTRSAWVGACAAIGLLLVLKDLRLLAVLPVLAAVFFVVAPPQVTERLYSMFDLQDPTNRDRLAMARAGGGMVRDHPLTGVGPDVVKDVYSEYRDALAVKEVNPHLHNVPLQIAAERGLPALAVWIWFVVLAVRGLLQKLKAGSDRALAAGGLAAIIAMLAAGMFEYNFGDSEFLMLLLVLITLPYAADRASSQA